MRVRILTVSYHGVTLPDLEQAIHDVATDCGLWYDSSGWDEESRELHFSCRSGRRAARAAADYITERVQGPILVTTYADLPNWVKAIREWWQLLRWTLTSHRDDPDRQHNVYILKYELSLFLRSLLPFARCDCGKYTRVFWRYRDPHYQDGKWIGPGDCLPF